MRISLCVEYCGSAYSGWQIQPECLTVQGVLEQAISIVADQSVATVCAGRTDAGVHGLNQIVHFDTDARRSMRSWLLGINSALPKDVSVKWACEVSADFHARFSALERSYRYLILNQTCRSALMHQRVHFEPRPLDLERMRLGAVHLLGQHDFSAFRAAACQAKSPVREIRHLHIEQRQNLLIVDVRANAFLQNMVRIITGVLLRVGRAEETPDWVQQVLVSRDRKHLGVTASPDGLYLAYVDYPPQFKLPQQCADKLDMPVFLSQDVK